ncbi:MAG: hypothetical protein KBD78_00415 [Oligoflexales bacterium]|nr:hypothetical protein [Oligoflexales bacterium]
MKINFSILVFASFLYSCGDQSSFKDTDDSFKSDSESQLNLYTAGDSIFEAKKYQCKSECQIIARTAFNLSVNGKDTRVEIVNLIENSTSFYIELRDQVLVKKQPLITSKIQNVCNKSALGKNTDCVIDTMEFHPSYKWLSITANGGYWNYSIDKIIKSSGEAVLAENSNSLLTVDRYLNGPCHSSLTQGKKCLFDSRAFLLRKNGLNIEVVESITAYGLYWNYVNQAPSPEHIVNPDRQVLGKLLTSVPRYINGPCSGKKNNACKFDSRSVVTDASFNQHETITVGSKYWTYVNGKSDYGNKYSYKTDWKKGINCARNQELGPEISVDVLLIEYNPILSNGQSAIEIAGQIEPGRWVSMKEHLWRETEFFNEVSCKRVKFNFVNHIIHRKIPQKQDGFQYTNEQWLDVALGKTPGHKPDYADYNKIIEENKICELVNEMGVDEVWIHGAMWFGFYESALISGPNSADPFWYNGPSFKSTCNKLVSIGIPGGHTFGHRAEATMTHVFGSWNMNATNHNWDRFGHNNFQTKHSNTYGCGSVHFPATNTGAYTYDSKTKVNTSCEDFLNYPNFKGTVSDIDCSAWGCDPKGYEAWWWNRLPMYKGQNTKGLLHDWWRYVFDPNLASTHKGKGQ